MDTNDVIESLAAKLAAADLTDAETDLLRTLIAEPDDDVAGYAIGWPLLLGAAVSTKGLLGDETHGRGGRPSTSTAVVHGAGVALDGRGLQRHSYGG